MLDVLIAGAGPTGLTLAGQLLARGIRCRIVDKIAVRSDRSRALVVQPRTLELLAKDGLADDLVASGQPTPRACVYVNGKRIIEADIGSLGSSDTPFPFLLFVSQVETERVLESYVRKQGGTVERPVELCSYVDAADGVTAQLRHGDGALESVRCRYIVGADGAHSVVRKGAGLSFLGAAYEQDFVLADVDVDSPLEHDRLVIAINDTGPFVVFPMKGERAVRILSIRGGKGNPDAEEPTLAEVQALANSRSPVPMTLSNPRWLARFHLHHRGVDRYRAGRAFVAGDAAHIHSPAGGQGMNTGIQDGYNLAWKLALVLRGQAPEPLLDSYNSERHPVGQALLRSTDRMFSMNTSDNPLVVAARNFVLTHVAPHLLESAKLREGGFRFIGQLSIEYTGSPAVGEDLHGADRRFRSGPSAGHRAPDCKISVDGREGSLLRDVLRGPGHHLLFFSGLDEKAVALATLQQAAERVAQWLPLFETSYLLHHQERLAADPAAHTSSGCVHSDSSGATHQRYGLSGPGYYLIRPDGYIAFRAPGTDVSSLRSYLSAHLSLPPS